MTVDAEAGRRTAFDRQAHRLATGGARAASAPAAWRGDAAARVDKGSRRANCPVVAEIAITAGNLLPESRRTLVDACGRSCGILIGDQQEEWSRAMAGVVSAATESLQPTAGV